MSETAECGAGADMPDVRPERARSSAAPSRPGVEGDGGETRLAGSDKLTDEAFDRVEALERFAAERGRPLLELALAALASEPGVAGVIAGATKPEQVRANAAADWQLSDAERDELRRLA